MANANGAWGHPGSLGDGPRGQGAHCWPEVGASVLWTPSQSHLNPFRRFLKRMPIRMRVTGYQSGTVLLILYVSICICVCVCVYTHIVADKENLTWGGQARLIG